MLRVIGTRLPYQRAGVVRCFCSKQSVETPTSQAPSIPDVKGVSEKVCNVPHEPVGFKGCTKETEYKSPEYFCYHVDSYHEAFVEMQDYRLPAPSNTKALK